LKKKNHHRQHPLTLVAIESTSMSVIMKFSCAFIISLLVAAPVVITARLSATNDDNNKYKQQQRVITALLTPVPAPPCNETYKTLLTSESACPTKPQGVVKMIKQSAESPPEGEPILYGIIFEPPNDINSAHTVKFKVDNPFTNHTDIFIKHMKKVGAYAMDSTCKYMPFTAGCQHNSEAVHPEIEAGCHKYNGVEPFAIINIYFASNSDHIVKEISSSSGSDVQIDKCCKPPYEEYAAKGYGIIKYTFEIQCTCPDETVVDA
jgi:hypothetical protein